jgi:hypothetical protein
MSDFIQCTCGAYIPVNPDTVYGYEADLLGGVVTYDAAHEPVKAPDPAPEPEELVAVCPKCQKILKYSKKGNPNA